MSPTIFLLAGAPAVGKSTAALARSLKRSGGGAAHAYIAAGINAVYDSLAEALPQLRQLGWRVLDIADLTVEATLSQIADGAV